MVKGLLVLFVSSLAVAGNVNFDFRFESDSSSYNNAAKAAGKTANTQYLMRTGKVDFKGKMNEEVSFRLRLRFDKDDATTVNKNDGFTSQVDYAYVQNQLAEGLQLFLGKFNSDIGGIEGNTSPADIYQPSQAYQQYSSQGFQYVTGAKIKYNLGDHEASFYVINQSDKTSNEQSKSAYGLNVTTLLMGKTLKPVFGYLFDEKQSSTAAAKISTTITSVGAKWDPKPYFITADYVIYAQKNVSAIGTDDTWNTLLIEAGYDLDGVIPRFKYEMSDKKSGSAKQKYDGFALGVEYKPYPQDIFRYHLMVTQMTTKPDVGDAMYEQHLLVGTRIYSDFLK